MKVRLKYNTIDMARELEVDVGVPVAVAADGDGHIIHGVLPAGRYATLMYVGQPSGLIAANGALLDWAAGQGLKWDMSPGEGGERWGSRLEIYLTDPAQEPDMAKWQTLLAFAWPDRPSEVAEPGPDIAINHPGVLVDCARGPVRRRAIGRAGSLSCRIAGQKLLEGCESGRIGRSRKPLWAHAHRGFKSHSLR